MPICHFQETALAERPKCEACRVYFEIRNPAGGWTPEQRFCGIWYDHPANSCGRRMGSVLYSSEGLLAHLAGDAS